LIADVSVSPFLMSWEAKKQKANGSAAEYLTKKQAKGTCAAEKKRWEETSCIYSVGVLFFELLAELDFANRRRVRRRGSAADSEAGAETVI